MLTWAPDMLTPVLGGALADFITEPAMRAQGGLAQTFGWLFGTGPGSGMSLVMVFFGAGCILTLLSGYLFPAVRNLDTLLPDHDQLQKIESAATT